MLFTTCLHSKTGAQNCKQTKCVNKFDTENNFILDYLSESSRHEANILSKWVWICSHYPPYTATWYSTPVSCSQIAMSPQNVLCTQCVFCLCCNLDLEVVPEHLLYGEQQPQKQVHPKLRASSNYSDFLKRHLHLRNRLLDQGYKKIRLIRSLKKFIFRYQYLVEIYTVSAEKIISDAFSYSENV